MARAVDWCHCSLGTSSKNVFCQLNFEVSRIAAELGLLLPPTALLPAAVRLLLLLLGTPTALTCVLTADVSCPANYTVSLLLLPAVPAAAFRRSVCGRAETPCRADAFRSSDFGSASARTISVSE